MPALPNRVLRAKLSAALSAGSHLDPDGENVHPALGTVARLGRTRFYLWTVTADRSARGRPPGEFKIQLILPGQSRHGRGTLENAGAYTALLGYSPDYGVFVGWQASLYGSFAYSRNVQCREELLREARDTGWAVAAPRIVGGREEVRVAFTPGNLEHYLRKSFEADQERGGAEGRWREAFFLANTPNATVRVPAPRDLEEFVQARRERVAATRLARDGRFSALVKEQYGQSCALCGVQLDIVEGAHIIPVREEGSADEVWNGVALCPNHHGLYDASAFVIRPDLNVRVDDDLVAYFRENNLDQGLGLLTDHDRRAIRPPAFWQRDARLRTRMMNALTRKTDLTGAAAP
jgi:putative restriction endonuclease